MSACSRTSLLSISKWLVGSSSNKKLSCSNESFAKASLAFSPPLNWAVDFSTSFPENQQRPHSVRISFSGIVVCRLQSSSNPVVLEFRPVKF